MMKTFLFILSLFLLPALADVYYVDQNHPQASDTNPGTEDSPWLTLQHSASAAKAGDTVIVMPGTYQRIRFDSSGTEGNYIVFKGSSIPDQSLITDPDAIFDTLNPQEILGNPEKNAVCGGFYFNADYIRVENFEITHIPEGQRAGIYLNKSDHNDIVNCFFHDLNPTLYDWGSVQGQGNNVLFKGNTLYRVPGVGININGENWLVEENEVSHGINIRTDNGEATGGDVDAVRFFGSGHIVRNNYLHDYLNIENVGEPHMDAFQTFSVYPESQFAHDILVEGNYCYNFGQMLMSEDQGEEAGTGNAVHHITFKYNIFRKCRAFAIIVSEYVDNFTFIHNVVAEANYGPITFTNHAHHATVLDNIFYNNGSGAALGDTTCKPGSVWDYNIHYPDFSWPIKQPEYDSSGFYGIDPEFVNPDSGDYRLLSSSIACRAASDSTDIGALPCMGCDDEFPITYFRLDKDYGYEPLTVSFDGSQTVPCNDSITNYIWNFGDGITGNGEKVNHTFWHGAHTVWLKTTNTYGNSDSTEKSVIVLPKQIPNLVLYLDCNKNVQDMSGNCNEVSWIGDSQYSTGPFGNGFAASFPGGDSGSYVKVDHNDILDGMDALSISLWIKKFQADSSGELLLKHVTYRIATSADGITGYLYNKDGTQFQFTYTDSVPVDTLWHHFVLVYNGASIMLYADTIMTGSVAASGSIAVNADRAIHIGKNPWGKTFHGSIDEFRMYNKALSKEEIVDLFIGTVDISDHFIPITKNALFTIYPHPVTSYTVIYYSVPQVSHITIRVYNLSGRLVRILINTKRQAGNYRTVWNGKDNKGNDVSNGMYLFRVMIGQKLLQKKVLLLR